MDAVPHPPDEWFAAERRSVVTRQQLIGATYHSTLRNFNQLLWLPPLTQRDHGDQQQKQRFAHVARKF